MKALRVALAIPAAFLAAAFAMRLLFAHAPASLAKGLAQPIAVVTAWNGFGAAALCVLVLAVAAATAAYARVCDLRAFAALRSPVAVAGIVALALAARGACRSFFPATSTRTPSTVNSRASAAIPTRTKCCRREMRSSMRPWCSGAIRRRRASTVRRSCGSPRPSPARLHRSGRSLQLDGLRALSSSALILCTLFGLCRLSRKAGRAARGGCDAAD